MVKDEGWCDKRGQGQGEMEAEKEEEEQKRPANLSQ